LEAIRKNLIVIAGPTAVGKTVVAIQLAKKLKTEIISADSRQFFRELTIGTAKPAVAELNEVKHHFINSHSIGDDYDAARFGEAALAVIHNLFKDHDHVILCGGSGLYIKAVVEGFDDIPEVAAEIRESLVQGYNLHGIGWLQQKMKESDPEHFMVIDQQNPHRLIRALEVKIGTGASIASFRNNEKRKHDFNVIKIGLELPREVLYKRIDGRMDDMIAQGLFQEAEQLYPFKDHQALQTVGYQEIFDLMDGSYDREEAVRLLKRNTRRYAKRQLTWFKRDEEMKWFSPDDLGGIGEYILSFGRYGSVVDN
jgi:tRNA dimethylallyltransferase